MVAALLVVFMQAGFLLLEVGFSRGKNAGTLVPKILINFSIAALAFWAVGFAFAFGGDTASGNPTDRHDGVLPAGLRSTRRRRSP